MDRDMEDTGKDLYTLGYEDAQANRAPTLPDDETYMMGFHDAQGDEEIQNTQAAYRPVDDEYALLGDAPLGFAWKYEKETPVPGDYYLTKAGGVKFATKVRKNSQQRHLLVPAVQCYCFEMRPTAHNRACSSSYHAKVSV